MNVRYLCATLATLMAAPLPVGAGVAPITYRVVYLGKERSAGRDANAEWKAQRHHHLPEVVREGFRH